MLSDLRESGAIEQDADSVLFLYRDEYYNPNTQDKNIAECIIAQKPPRRDRHGQAAVAAAVLHLLRSGVEA
ncbi:MAG: DnaB-like helicase C-terminal domain-containing protein [Oscillospiraceae bacterium]